MAMKCVVASNGKSVTITLDIEQERRISSTGKTFLLAVGSDKVAIGKEVATIRVNMTVPAEK